MKTRIFASMFLFIALPLLAFAMPGVSLTSQDRVYAVGKEAALRASSETLESMGFHVESVDVDAGILQASNPADTLVPTGVRWVVMVEPIPDGMVIISLYGARVARSGPASPAQSYEDFYSRFFEALETRAPTNAGAGAE